MKNKISKIMGVLVTLGVVASMFVTSLPASAAIGVDQVVNKWSEVSLSSAMAPSSEVGPMVVTPDGIFAAFYSDDDGEWSIMKSTDGGGSWKATKLSTENETGIPDDNDWWYDDTSPVDATPVDLAYSAPNKTLYVACLNGDIYRLRGELQPVLLKTIVDSNGDTLGTYTGPGGAGFLFDIDVMYDGSANWITVACSLDVLILKDSTFEEWRDMQLASAGDYGHAVEVRFSPKFTVDQLVWCVADPFENNQLWVLATDSPGRWGQVIAPVQLVNTELGGEGEEEFGDTSDYDPYLYWSPFVDMEFASDYNGTTIFNSFVSVADRDIFEEGGGIWLVYGAKVPEASQAQMLELLGTDIGSIAVSGDTILANDTWDGTVFISTDGGATFDEADKNPTGQFWGHVYMALDFATSKTAYYSGMDYNISDSDSGFNISRDGGKTWNQTSLVDVEVNWIKSSIVTVAPDGKKAFVAVGDDDDESNLWRTMDVTVKAPVWERVATDDQLGTDTFSKVGFTPDGKTVMLYVDDDGDWSIMRSTNDGQTFTHWRSFPTIGYARDWFIVDANTVYMATASDGFYATRATGPAITGLETVGLASIDVLGDKIIVGSNNGKAYISLDKGLTWSAGTSVGSTGNDVFVAVGPDGKFYAAGAKSTGTDVVAITYSSTTLLWTAKAVSDSASLKATEVGFSGIWVSPDNTLYALGGTEEVTGTEYGHAYAFTPDDGSVLHFEGLDSGAWAHLVVDDVHINVLSGTFYEGTEALNIIGANVKALSSTVLQGTVYVQGVDSDATGSFDVFYYGQDSFSGEFWAGSSGNPGEDIAVTVEGSLSSTRDDEDVTLTPSSGNLYRLLVGETGNIWEKAPIEDAYRLVGSVGSNVAWTVVNDDELWALQDTLSGKIAGVAVSAIGETKATVAWTSMLGAKQYEMKYSSTVNDVTTTVNQLGTTTIVAPATAVAPTEKLTGLTNNLKYTVQVRVATGMTFQSRWSDKVDFTTLETITAPVAPYNLVPANGAIDIPVKGPAFAWLAVPNAVRYEFVISKNPDFTSPVFSSTTLTVPNIVLTTALENETAYYWRVRAVSATGTMSAWVNNVFTTVKLVIPPVTVTNPPAITLTQAPALPVPTIILSQQPVVTVTQAAVVPTPTFTLPQATIVIAQPESNTPTYIWIIVGVGALLTLAVIVLIIRTRRVV